MFFSNMIQSPDIGGGLYCENVSQTHFFQEQNISATKKKTHNMDVAPVPSWCIFPELQKPLSTFPLTIAAVS